MAEWFRELDPILQALLGGGLTWFATAAAALLVFVSHGLPRVVLDALLGFAAGVMIAASVWSLLLPSLEMGGPTGLPSWFPAVVGFLAGGVVLRLGDRFLPHLHLGFPREEAEGVETTWRRTTLLVMAITLHNIPEGLAIGVAFGAVATGESIAGAVALTVGIAIQNVPEGLAVAMPLRREGVSAGRSFWYGQASALVEPVAAVVGAAAIVLMSALLPYALAFAAGAMIFVVVEELIPESQRAGRTDLATGGTLVGFALMMALDVGFG